MAKKADIEKPISLMRPANAKSVQAVLDRANKASARESKAVIRNAGKISSGVRGGKSQLAKALGTALAFHGRSKKGGPSIRPTAKDTGGRAFHYSHSTVSKDGGGSKGGGATGSGSKSAASTAGGPTSGGNPGGGTKEAAHQAYVERDSAVAPQRPLEHGGHEATLANGRPVERDGWERRLEPGRSTGKGAHEIKVDLEAAMETVANLTPGAHLHSPVAAQEYIEDPTKVEQRYGHANSFGTIGETYEERLAFWGLVHEHEREQDARTQTRLVLELPHEATAEARQEIIRRHCAWFEERGIPYWAAIHAPTKDNDSRNHHAHVVFIDRPAKKMPHPETGAMAWDFTIQVKKRDKTRHTKITYPYRQKKPRDMMDHKFVKISRARFAKTVNDVLEETKSKIRYDPRSYKDMGLDIEPMKNVSRITADKMKSHDFVAMDADWTRKMIEREMANAAMARDKTFLRLRKVERQLDEATRDIRSPLRANQKLPPKLRLGPDSILTSTAATKLVIKIIEHERDRLTEQFARENTRRALMHVLEATSPISARRATARKVYTKGDVAPPDPEALALLHQAAKDELAQFDREHRSWRVQTADKIRATYDRWQRSANPSQYKPRAQPSEPTTPKTQAAPVPPAKTTPPPPSPTARTNSTVRPTLPPGYASGILTPQHAPGKLFIYTTPAAAPAQQETPAKPVREAPKLPTDPAVVKDPTKDLIAKVLGGPDSRASKIFKMMTGLLTTTNPFGEDVVLTPDILKQSLDAWNDVAKKNAAIVEAIKQADPTNLGQRPLAPQQPIPDQPVAPAPPNPTPTVTPSTVQQPLTTAASPINRPVKEAAIPASRPPEAPPPPIIAPPEPVYTTRMLTPEERALARGIPPTPRPAATPPRTEAAAALDQPTARTPPAAPPPTRTTPADARALPTQPTQADETRPTPPVSTPTQDPVPGPRPTTANEANQTSVDFIRSVVPRPLSRTNLTNRAPRPPRKRGDIDDQPSLDLTAPSPPQPPRDLTTDSPTPNRPDPELPDLNEPQPEPGSTESAPIDDKELERKKRAKDKRRGVLRNRPGRER